MLVRAGAATVSMLSQLSSSLGNESIDALFERSSSVNTSEGREIFFDRIRRGRHRIPLGFHVRRVSKVFDAYNEW